MRSAIWFSIACLAAPSATPVFAVDGPETPGASAGVDAEASYARALEKRAKDVLDVLKLDDPAKADRVREAVIAQYRSLRALHDARDARIKSLRDRQGLDRADRDGQIKAEREQTAAAAAAQHQRFLAQLSVDLSPAQIEQVKDKMTYNKLQVTYNGYLEMLPALTTEQKQAVVDMLKLAREEAAYAGSSEEKSEIFNKYKGRINNYLATQGYDLKRASAEWAERRKKSK